MRKWSINVILVFLAFACSIIGAPLVAQEKKDGDTQTRDAGLKALSEWIGMSPKDGSLEEQLAKALKNNPDILLAHAKLREAEAELNRTRQQVMQKVVVLSKEIAAQQALVKDLEFRFKSAEELRKQRVSTEADFRAAEAALQKAKADLEVIQAKMPYLIGKQPAARNLTDIYERTFIEHLNLPTEALVGRKTQGINEDMAEKIRAALDTRLKRDYVEVRLTDILADLADRAKSINIEVHAQEIPRDFTTSLKLANPVPLGAALQYLEDRLDLRCIVRNYGVVLVNKDLVPPGAVLLQDFWKPAPPNVEKK